MDEPIGVVIAVALLTGAFFFGVGLTRSSICRDAVKAGAAEYYLDTNYSKQFRWKTNAVGRE